jgi:Zn-finger nucleic acid-binding protein
VAWAISLAMSCRGVWLGRSAWRCHVAACGLGVQHGDVMSRRVAWAFSMAMSCRGVWLGRSAWRCHVAACGLGDQPGDVMSRRVAWAFSMAMSCRGVWLGRSAWRCHVAACGLGVQPGDGASRRVACGFRIDPAAGMAVVHTSAAWARCRGPRTPRAFTRMLRRCDVAPHTLVAPTRCSRRHERCDL